MRRLNAVRNQDGKGASGYVIVKVMQEVPYHVIVTKNPFYEIRYRIKTVPNVNQKVIPGQHKISPPLHAKQVALGG
jgi:predicted GTPase